MIEVSQSRGCWKVSELRDIGVTYNSLCKILKELGKLQNTQNTQEQQVHDTGDSGNTSNTESVVDGKENKVLNI